MGKVKAAPAPIARQRLDEKYQPRKLEDFVGMEREKKILLAFAANPYSSAWLLWGPSGIGKTTMALALCDLMGAELHHVPSRSCNLDSVAELRNTCYHVPFGNGFHFCLIDEADQMTGAAQLAFLSVLDTTQMPPQTVFCFTANSILTLEDRFQSRCRVLHFNVTSMADPIVDLLKRVWEKEAPGSKHQPDFKAIAEASRLNVRRALGTLELELIAPGSFVPPPPVEIAPPPAQVIHHATPYVVAPIERNVDPVRSDACKRAWITIRRNRELRAQGILPPKSR